MGRAQTSSTPPSAAARTDSSLTMKARSEEHTSELQSPCNLVCRLLLEKKKKHDIRNRGVFCRRCDEGADEEYYYRRRGQRRSSHAVHDRVDPAGRTGLFVIYLSNSVLS